jgi:hypothetical protein
LLLIIWMGGLSIWLIALPLTLMTAWGRADEGRASNGCKRIFYVSLIQAVCVSPYFTWRQSQDIGSQDDFGDWGIEDGEQMRVLCGCDFPVPPGLRDVDDLAWSNMIMKNLIRKWIDEGNIRRSGNAVHQLCSILMVMRLHDITRTEKDVQQ